MSQPQSVPLAPGAPWVELTALELHPDGHRLRLTHAEYPGSAFYGPALAELLPGATPIRRLSHEVLPDAAARPLRRVVWLLDSDGHGEGWHTPAQLPEDSQPWIQAALASEPPRRPHWQRRGGWAALLAWLDTELEAQGWARLGVPQVLKDGGISFLARVETTAGRVYLKAVPDFFRLRLASPAPSGTGCREGRPRCWPQTAFVTCCCCETRASRYPGRCLQAQTRLRN